MRTTESQVHRELASGLSCPVGFKNGTDGTIKVAIDAIGAANAPHHFLSVTKFGHSAIVSTKGNPDCHIILRGGREPNYSAPHVAQISEQLQKAKLPDNVMIDFSHANSSKQYQRQMVVAQDVADQVAAGNKAIFGVMVESHLVEGRQDLVEGQDLCYGQSITDACIGWDDTERLLAVLAQSVIERRKAKSRSVSKIKALFSAFIFMIYCLFRLNIRLLWLSYQRRQSGCFDLCPEFLDCLILSSSTPKFGSVVMAGIEL